MNGRELKKPLSPFDFCRIKKWAALSRLLYGISSRMPSCPTLSTERIFLRQFLPTDARHTDNLSPARPAIRTHPGHETPCPASMSRPGSRPSRPFSGRLLPHFTSMCAIDTLDPIRQPSHTRTDLHPDGSHANHNANLPCHSR